MICFHNNDDSVEIDVARKEGAKSLAVGDSYLTVQVSSHGFAGQNDLWVLSGSLQTFCRDLFRLAESRQGSATIESISPDELKITIRSLDRLGHMIVEGETGYHVPSENGSIWHSIIFGFEFDPSQLEQSTRTPWVRASAESLR